MINPKSNPSLALFIKNYQKQQEEASIKNQRVTSTLFPSIKHTPNSSYIKQVSKFGKIPWKSSVLTYVLIFFAFILYGSFISFMIQSETKKEIMPIKKIQSRAEEMEVVLKSQKVQKSEALDYELAIKGNQGGMVQLIQKTYQLFQKEVQRAEKNIFEKNTKLINKVKKETLHELNLSSLQQPHHQKQPEAQAQPQAQSSTQTKPSREQSTLKEESQQTKTQPYPHEVVQPFKQNQKTKQKAILVKLKLFPYLQSWATSGRPSTLVQSIAYQLVFKNVFGQNYYWEDLYEMLKYGGYWESNGNFLTVATYSKVIEDKFGSLQIFVPSIITIEFPYDTSDNEVVSIQGIRMRYDLYRRVETRWLSEDLGKIHVKVTEEERRLRKPVKRTFYCETVECSRLYSMIRFQTVNRLRIHSLKIDSILIIG